MVLGVVFKQLFAVPLFLLNMALSSVVLVMAVSLWSNEADTGKNRKNKPGFIKTVLSEFTDETGRIIRIIRKDRVLFWVFNLLLISVSWMVFQGYLFPSYTWDALWYHMPIVGYIIQSGAIQENATPSVIDLFINIFPKNIELYFVWNTIFLKSDIVSDLSQLFFTIMGVIAVFSIAVKLGLKERYAIYSAVLFFFTPVVILQSTTNYVDVAVGVLLLVAINFLMYDNPNSIPAKKENPVPAENSKIPVLLAGLSAGILLGSKGSGPLFIVILAGALAAQELIKRFNPFDLFSFRQNGYSLKSGFYLYLLYFFVPVLLMGGYWYIKNLVLYSNPVYPFEISFLNFTIFEGTYDGIIDPTPDILGGMSALIRPFYVWMEKVEYYLYDSRLSGFGPIWFILLLPCIVTAVAQALKGKKYNFLFVASILLITFILYPRNWYPRYVIFLPGLGALSFGLTLEYFNKRQSAIKAIAFLLVVYTFLTANSPCVVPWKIKEFLNLPAGERTIARHAPFNIDLQARQEYGLWIWVSRNMAGGKTLAYTYEPLFLSPLWNSGFENRVVYVTADSFKEWLKRLKDNNVTHILVKQNSREDKWIIEVKKLVQSLWWAGGTPEKFDVVYSDEIYKVMSFSYANERK